MTTASYAGMPAPYTDQMTATTVRVSAYLHGAGAGDAGLQITLVDHAIERAVCLRLPGPVAEEWLGATLQALKQARARAVIEPWGDPNAG